MPRGCFSAGHVCQILLVPGVTICPRQEAMPRPPRSLWSSLTSSCAWILSHCPPVGQVTPWGSSLENVHDPQLQHRAGSLSTYPCRPRPPGETQSRLEPAQPHDHMVQDIADERDGGAQRNVSGKTPWRRWHLHGVEEEKTDCFRAAIAFGDVCVCTHTCTHVHTSIRAHKHT